MRYFPGRPGLPAKPSGRLLVPVIAAWILSAPGRADASGLPGPLDPGGPGSLMAPATAPFTAPSHPLPTSFTLPSPAIARLEAGRPLIPTGDFALSTPRGPRERPDFGAQGFSGRLMARMRREALRYRRQNVSDVTAAVSDRVFEDLDSQALERRSHEASRIVTRSVKRALDVEIERLARTSLGLGRTIDLLGGLSSRGARPQSPAGQVSPVGTSPSAAGASEGGWHGGVGIRLDAHPALLMRADARRFAGRLEIPVRDEPIRLSVECPVGPMGRAVLSSGMPRDGQGWATVMLNFSF